MLDIISLISQLKRPRLLVRAARFGLDDYRRDRHLKRTLATDSLPRHGAAILRLMEIEAEMNENRLQKQAAYSVAHHVEVLVAIMGEAQTLRAISRPTLT